VSGSEIFASHALSLPWEALPAAARDAARVFLLDTISVGVAGAAAPFADAVMAAEAVGGSGPACVLGRAERLPVRAAAFVNAYQIHAQEFDCVHEPAVLHPYSAVLGALAAECTARRDVAGTEFGAALVAGVDISVSLGLAATGPLTFFRPATAGIFGATAAVARVRRLTHAQTVAALGHALCFTAGTMQAHVEGTPGLALQVAAAARGAIEGPFGYLSLFETASDIAPVLARLGRVFAVTELSHKPFPTGRAAHGGIAAVQTLMRTHGAAADDVASLCYIAPSLIARLVGRPAQTGMRAAYARLCLPYLAARTMLHGAVGLDAFSPAALDDAAVLALAAHVAVDVDDNPDPAAFTPALLRADLRDGRRIEIPVPHLPGSPAAPLDVAARLDKVRQCLAFAGIAVDPGEFAERIEALDQMADMRRLLTVATENIEDEA
jgi:2-methylcitrate dehydratase PrpD